LLSKLTLSRLVSSFIIVTLSLSIFAGLGLAPILDAQAATNEKIVFAGTINGGALDLYLMNPDGSGVTQLTDTSGYEHSPNWSPDGSKILFVRQTLGDIYTITADGKEEERLTQGGWISEPSWSPDGRQIVYSFGGVNNGAEIYVMNVDGTGEMRLTTNDRADNRPAWSPDGTMIAFIRNSYEIWIMNAVGTDAKKLTDSVAHLWYPISWSPDGTKILYTGRDSQLYSMNADGTGQTKMTSGFRQTLYASWGVVSAALLPSISINDITEYERTSGPYNFVFTVTRSGDTSISSSVDFTTQDGTASAGSDYVAKSGTLTFAPGEKSKTISIQINSDMEQESAETFYVKLSDCNSCIFSDAVGTGTILDAARLQDVSETEGTVGGTVLQKPTARISAPGPYVVGQAITFDGSKSTDGDGEVVNYHWDFGDGATANSKIATHTYARTGAFVAVLTVTDNDRNNDEERLSIMVEGKDGGGKPIAKIGVQGSREQGKPVTLDGSLSSAPDGGRIVSYEWSYGGNSIGTGSSISHTFDEPGTYTVSLKVADEKGIASVETKEIEIKPLVVETAFYEDPYFIVGAMGGIGTLITVIIALRRRK
jgi:PKD repeat protein